MPVRSLTSSILKWPTEREVSQAVTSWATSLGRTDPNIQKIGYRGSYADGTWGVGSDVDLVIVLESIDRDFLERGRGFDATPLPVPADALVYSSEEQNHQGRALVDTIWVYHRASGNEHQERVEAAMSEVTSSHDEALKRLGE